ncbi:hypothetical protein ACLX1H_005776 [Fusarium chlamydosporum]
MRPKVKVGVYAIFLLGSIDVAVSLARFLTVQLAAVGSFRSITTVVELWSALDVYIGLIIACLPALRPYLRRKGSKFSYEESGRPTGNSTHPVRRTVDRGFRELDETPSLEGDAGPASWAVKHSPEFGATEWSDKKSTRSDVELAFAAGAALCSTSLGTTFTILGTSGLSSTRLGVVLTSAAMMDDVVGLIMVQVISNLGDGSFDAVTVVRPIMVSLAFAIVVPILCRFMVLPISVRLNSYREAYPSSTVSRLFDMKQTAFAIHTAYLLGMVIGATFAGTSSLLAAYIAGATISWWDSEVPHLQARDTNIGVAGDSEQTVAIENQTVERFSSVQAVSPKIMDGGSGTEIFGDYYEPALQRLLKPFFFASIGFSVPITQLFTGPVVWRGVIYTILMIFAKLACGLWLISFSNPFQMFARPIRKLTPTFKKSTKNLVPGAQCADNSPQDEISGPIQRAEERDALPLESLNATNTPQASAQARNSTPKPEKALSLYPACIVGIGMVARGEIGYLISALAESKE